MQNNNTNLIIEDIVNSQEYIDAHTLIHSLNHIEVIYYISLFLCYLPKKYESKFKAYIKYRYKHKDGYAWVRETTYRRICYLEKIAYKNMFKLNLESKCEYIKYFKLLEDFNSEYLHLMMAYCKLKEFLSDFHIKYLIEFSSQLSWLREQDWVISRDFGLTLIDNDLLDYICNYNRKIEKDNIEKILHTDVIENFNKIFPEYTFIKEEYEVKNIGKIDILARDSRSNRDVVIEIKKDKGNPNKQLLAYANGFVNPILIGITNMNKKYYLDNIVYYTWKTIENKSKKR